MDIIDGLPEANWSGLGHRDATALLLTRGWNLCGVGQWAVALRSPSGRLAARVCPFDPAYDVYMRLCRELPDHPYLPRVQTHLDLDGGAQLTIMEYLTATDDETAALVKKQWDDRANPELTRLRDTAERVNDEAAAEIAWWDTIDLNEGNVMASADGHPKLVDMYCMDGQALYAALLDDPAAIAAAIPPGKRRYLTDITFIAGHSTTEELAALRAAAARVDGD
ncbi:hypothetical protein [Stackebrandtia soli]|uniref:hypothetical protein n=1 Tax=Stackebrandtia soli TaxID=1892856 RepID=UPI0039EC008D